MIKKLALRAATVAEFVICDPPTIHNASLNCKLSRAVKFKSLF